LGSAAAEVGMAAVSTSGADCNSRSRSSSTQSDARAVLMLDASRRKAIARHGSLRIDEPSHHSINIMPTRLQTIGDGESLERYQSPAIARIAGPDCEIRVSHNV